MIRDRVRQTSTTSGTGPLVLNGIVDAYEPFAAADLADDDPLYYCVVDGINFEVIAGTFQTGSPYPSLTRDRSIRSSTGSPINFSANPKDVFIVSPAEVFGPAGGHLIKATATLSGTAYSASVPLPMPVLLDGARVRIRVVATNPANCTLNINETADKAWKIGTPPRALAQGQVPAAAEVDCVWDATEDCWVLVAGLKPGGVKAVSTTTYTVLAEDDEVLLVFTHASGCAVTVPEATAAFAEPFKFPYSAAGGAVVFTPTTSTINGFATLSAASGQSGTWFADGANYRSTQAQTAKAPPKRHTVMSGHVTSGLTDFMAIGTGLSVNIAATATPLVITGAYGFDISGAVDRLGLIVADTVLSGLTANSINFIYADIDANGGVTLGKTTLAPVFQYSGAYSTTLGQYTFNIQDMTGKVGNGTTADLTCRVFLGRAVTGFSTVTSVNCVPLNARVVGEFSSIANGGAHLTNHFIFSDRLNVKWSFICISADLGYSAGYNVEAADTYQGGTSARGLTVEYDELFAVMLLGTSGFYLIPYSLGAAALADTTKWKGRMTIERSW
jgi:hypothetical protein